ncbi:alpha/beta hydrolase family esterase [Humibacter sp.]|uniref:alpha/beta hydrolase family esterase n=1 Tax=Humibacter sp. TaxID=1940291 RepID=UPI003F7F2DB7
MRRRLLAIVLLSSVLLLVVCAGVLWLTVGVGGKTPQAETSSSANSVTPVATAGPMTAGNHTLSIDVQGHARTLILHIPQAATAQRPLGLALVFHGAYETASDSEKKTDITAAANTHGFLVAYMQGYKDTWNDHNGHTAAQAAGIDDVAYTRAALAAIEKRVSVDTGRIVAVGFSNGALFADLLGCEFPEPFSAIVMAEGQFSTPVAASCRPNKPLSVLQINGTADPTVPYDGGSVTLSGSTVHFLSAHEAISQWARHDGCSATPQKTSAGSGVSVETYQACSNGVSVQLRTIDGGVHAWPQDIGALLTNALG